MDEFRKYEQMRDDGAGPGDVYLAAKHDGVAAVALIRLLRSVFDLSLVQAKEVTVIANEQAVSLSAHQEALLPALEGTLIEAEAAKAHR